MDNNFGLTRRTSSNHESVTTMKVRMFSPLSNGVTNFSKAYWKMMYLVQIDRRKILNKIVLVNLTQLYNYHD